MEPMHDRYAKSDHEQFLDTLKSDGERGIRPFLMTGYHGREKVVPWLMIGAVLGGTPDAQRGRRDRRRGARLWWLVPGHPIVWRRVRPPHLGAIEAGALLPDRRRGRICCRLRAQRGRYQVGLFLATTIGVAAGVARYQFGGKTPS